MVATSTGSFVNVTRSILCSSGGSLHHTGDPERLGGIFMWQIQVIFAEPPHGSCSCEAVIQGYSNPNQNKTKGKTRTERALLSHLIGCYALVATWGGQQPMSTFMTITYDVGETLAAGNIRSAIATASLFIS